MKTLMHSTVIGCGLQCSTKTWRPMCRVHHVGGHRVQQAAGQGGGRPAQAGPADHRAAEVGLPAATPYHRSVTHGNETAHAHLERADANWTLYRRQTSLLVVMRAACMESVLLWGAGPPKGCLRTCRSARSATLAASWARSCSPWAAPRPDRHEHHPLYTLLTRNCLYHCTGFQAGHIAAGLHAAVLEPSTFHRCRWPSCRCRCWRHALATAPAGSTTQCGASAMSRCRWALPLLRRSTAQQCRVVAPQCQAAVFLQQGLPSAPAAEGCTCTLFSDRENSAGHLAQS